MEDVVKYLKLQLAINDIEPENFVRFLIEDYKDYQERQRWGEAERSAYNSAMEDSMSYGSDD